MEQAVRDAADSFMISFGDGATVTPDCTPGTNPGDDVTCRVDFTYNFLVLRPLVALLGGSLPGALTQRSTTIMRME
jgi:hypothetical protein